MAQKPTGPETIDVLPTNWDAVRIFSLAKPTWLLGFGIARYHGLSAEEIRNTACACQVRFDENLMTRLRVLEAGYGEIANSK